MGAGGEGTSEGVPTAAARSAIGRVDRAGRADRNLAFLSSDGRNFVTCNPLLVTSAVERARAKSASGSAWHGSLGLNSIDFPKIFLRIFPSLETYLNSRLPY